MLACLDTLLSACYPLLATARAQLALRHRGLGLRSTARHAPAAYWISWADVLPRDPAYARALVDSLAGASPAPEVLQSLPFAPASLTASGFAPPPWPELLTTPAPHPDDEDEEPQLDTGPSTSSAAALKSHLHLHASECCCCGAYGPPCRSLPISAAADVTFYPPEVPHLSVLPLVFAVKLVLRLQPRSRCGTSMSHPAVKMTIELGIANGLPHSLDTTLVSPLIAAGELRRESRRTAGAGPARLRCCPCLHDQPPFPPAYRSSQCRRSSAPQ